MKKFTKCSLIAGTACLVVGTAVLTVAFALDSRLHEEIRRAKDEIASEVMREGRTEHVPQITQAQQPADDYEETGRMFEGIEKLDIEVNGGAIQVMKGDEGQSITVFISDPSGKSSCYVEDAGELKVKIQSAGKTMVKDDRQIQVVVPEGYEFREAEFKVRSGFLDVESVAAGKVEIEVNSGMAEFTEVMAERSIEAECESGDLNIFVNQAESEFDYNIKARSGGIVLGDQYYGDGRGGEWDVNNGSGRKIELESDSGMIVMNFKDEA